MRIIGGTAGGRILKAPKGFDVRPTPDLVRQAVFNSLGERVGGASVLFPGITVGENALIGAGSVVTRDVADRTIVAGNPARLVGRVPADHII